MSFTFVAEVESPRPHYHWHTVRCEGEWAESDGDHIRPGFKFFNPERVWLIHNCDHSRLLQDIPQWLWDTLSYQGEDAWRDEKADADFERAESQDEEDWYDFKGDDIAF